VQQLGWPCTVQMGTTQKRPGRFFPHHVGRQGSSGDNIGHALSKQVCHSNDKDGTSLITWVDKVVLGNIVHLQPLPPELLRQAPSSKALTSLTATHPNLSTSFTNINNKK